jgi:hypothetical protein
MVGVRRGQAPTRASQDPHFHSYAAKLVLTDIVQTKKYGPLYATATFSYSVGGKKKSETFGLAT